jgi:hypothetical protein
MKKRAGSALIMVVILAGVLMLMAVIAAKIVYNSYRTLELIGRREQAFWLAEAGLEQGKANLARNPDWYTDLSHDPADDVPWLAQSAVGALGNLPSGSFKIVREKDKDRLYCVGASGPARVAVKIVFQSAPVKALSWAEL